MADHGISELGIGSEQTVGSQTERYRIPIMDNLHTIPAHTRELFAFSNAEPYFPFLMGNDESRMGKEPIVFAEQGNHARILMQERERFGLDQRFAPQDMQALCFESEPVNLGG